MLYDKQQAISVPLSIMENNTFITTNIPGNSNKLNLVNPTGKGCVVVQTCDVYRQYWDSFFWSFHKYWDKRIDWHVYFCNEVEPININIPGINISQICTGSGSHSFRFARILDSLKEYDYVFYMLEDFWMTNPMTKEMFDGLFEIMRTNSWDSLRVSPYMPAYYKLEPTEYFFQNKRILKFAKESDWLFSQQASFWKRDFLRKCIVEAKTSEQKIGSSIVGEIAMDKYLHQTYSEAKIYLYHYHWYPISGSVWRGKLTQMGEQIEFLRQVDTIFNQQFG